MDVLYRLCWNKDSWKKPSGACSHDGGYPNKCGYGHEEWNFNLGDAVDNYVYAYVREAPSKTKIRAGDTFRIGFWSKSPSGKVFMVGIYEEAELSCIDRDTKLRQRVDSEFLNRGIYRRRASEVFSLDLLNSDHMCLPGPPRRGEKPPSKYTLKQISDSIMGAIKKGEYLIRCPTNKIRIFPQFVEIVGEPADKLRRTRFRTPSQKIAKSPQISSILNNPDVILKQLSEETANRTITARNIDVEPKHNKLSNRFVNWLRSNGLFPHVERKPIDVDFFIGDLLVRAELKIESSGGIRECIRQAIGQLLEYNYYFEAIPRAEKWIIVLESQPSQHDIDYVETFSSKHNMPLNLMWQSKTGFDIATPGFLPL